MSSLFRDRDRERLEHELQNISHQELLARLQRQEPLLRQFNMWAEVLTFMRSASSDPRKDGILRSVLAAHADDQDPRWFAVLLAIFWPGLRSIHRQKLRWDMEDPDELWQRITWAFLQVICRVDVRRRRDRFAAKLFNDTVHRLHDEYRRDWDRARREVRPDPDDPEAFDALVAGVEGIDFAGIELREAQELESKRLRAHLAAGRISEADFLLLGTRIYGQSVADYAREMGLAYQVAKKRRQRAEAAIRRFEEKEPGGPRGLSPSSATCPPLVVSG